MSSRALLPLTFTVQKKDGKGRFLLELSAQMFGHQSQAPPTHRQPLDCRFKKMLRLNRGPIIVLRFRTLPRSHRPRTSYSDVNCCRHGGLWEDKEAEQNEQVAVPKWRDTFEELFLCYRETSMLPW